MVAQGPGPDDLKARLLSRRLDEAAVEIPGVGTIRLRGLSRGEVFGARKASRNEDEFEVHLLALALVDPAMTVDDVRQWQAASPAGEIEGLTAKINELSGMGQGADKSGVPGVRDDGPGVRALPGAEAVDDGGAAARADEQ